ncbi:MAG: 50S ribosomal protein L23 [Candidatus Kaiserbacteria bacterium GW2011_GWB1_52_6]|uniref:50S ribosomal protein L23 n=3 Tax=Candidatus Kaiseribacteriota TaxID=1752734 RepID=A0A0G1ZUN1_9BACT|nr:MAG: 50S ribosomal protein L23 [Candidatus Kaiserbacteria bacterium GW2011_GWA2_52_12]KKW26238.1 MAG: 50S ribosomal protein L23 [Candidatus Kaiserbacteria bacterium GW2011_GWB1_52_6]KKW32047.1 MAG: 50S ribosomal protein L23 [Candidatus Kaiserbacteria bacterium GW2011_GWC2_52_8b]
MALFSKKISKPASEAPVKEKKTKMEKATPVSIATSGGNAVAQVLKHARITEKASMHQSEGVYTFDIAEGATKNQVTQAVFALYKVTPRLVRVVKVPSKVRRNARTGKMGIKRGGRKAYVFLKKGETITIA